MAHSSISPAAIEHYRSVAAMLSDPRDVTVIKQYASELEQLARSGRRGGTGY